MVQTNSHRFNTHVKRLSLSASVVIIIITHLLATSRIISQYFNHLLLYSFTTSPLKIDESLSTFQFCHTDRSKAVLLLWIFYVFVLSCVCYVFVRVCLYVLCGHLLGKGWPLGSRLWCLLWVCHFPIGILGQVWYLNVSIPDLFTLTYLEHSQKLIWSPNS